MRWGIALVTACALASTAEAPEMTRTVAIAPSADLIALPELASPGVEKDVHAGDYVSWSAMFSANPTADTFNLFAEDYTGMGLPGIGSAHSGTLGQKRVIRYNGPEASLPPWERTPGNEALIREFTFAPAFNNIPHDFILHGLTIRGATSESIIRYGSTRIVIDQCLIEDGSATYGIRFMLFAFNNAVQRCMIRNPSVLSDGVGVQLRTPTAAQGTGTMHDNRIVDCIIVDYNDSIQITSVNSENRDIFDGTIIDGNTLMATDASHTANGHGNVENAIDMKNGSSSALSPVRISNNRMRGFRYYPGRSDGSAIVIQQYTKNVLIEDNFFRDMPHAIRQEVWPVGFPQIDRGVIVRGNVFTDISIFAAEDNGTVISSPMPLTAEDNVFAHCTSLRTGTDSTVTPWTMNDNTAVDCPLGTASTAWAAGTGNVTLTLPDTSSVFLEDYDPDTGEIVVEELENCDLSPTATGDLSKTFDSLSLSASGVLVPAIGTLDAQLDAMTVSATGLLSLFVAVDATLDDMSVVSAGLARSTPRNPGAVVVGQRHAGVSIAPVRLRVEE